MYQRMAAMAAFSCLILATPALARDHHRAADAPCDADVGAFDDSYESVALLTGHSYFPEEQAAPGNQQAAPDSDAEADDDADSSDDPDADSDDDGDTDNQGCAEIMVTPYDIMIQQPDQKPQWAALRREPLVVRKPELI